MKTHWKKLINPDYLGAYSLPDGKDMTVTIDKVVREMVTGTGGKKEECTVAHLIGNHKPVILNNTNCKTIQKIYDTPFIEEWSGKPITLYVAKIKAFGEDNIECLRIRAKVATLPELKPDTKEWTKCLAALKGDYTIDQIETKYSLSESNREQLISEAI